MNKFKLEIGQRIEQLMYEKGIKRKDLCDKLDCMNSIIKDEYETCHNRFIENIDNMDSQTIKYRKWQSTG